MRCSWVRLIAVVAVVACGDSQQPHPGSGLDAGLDAGPDASLDAGSDAGNNSGPLTLELLAGDGNGPGNVDGTGAAARFDLPQGIAVDGDGNVYVADQFNNAIRKITVAGVVTTLTGAEHVQGSADGTGAAARFNSPSGVAVDGSTVYVADAANHTIRKITPAGVVTTLAGAAGLVGSADGTGAAARFHRPFGIAVGHGGTLYVTDQFNHTVRKITPAGEVTTLAGSVGIPGTVDGTGAAASLDFPSGVAVDGDDNIYVTEQHGAVRQITSTGVVTTVVRNARLQGPSGVAVDNTGTLYVADQLNHAIRKITALGEVTTLAGSVGMAGSADGTGAAARFNAPIGVALSVGGTLYVADSSNHTIRAVAPSGMVTTLAGTASLIGSADGTGAAARFNVPTGLAADVAGNVYVADSSNNTIRKITTAGAVSTLAGTAGTSGGDDGTGPLARFNNPFGMAIDGEGNVYVADTNNATVRKITPAGAVTTLAGSAGMFGSVDGTGAAARFNGLLGAAVDRSGNVYVTDLVSATIRKVSAAGVTTTLAGMDGVIGSADGTGAAARFSIPAGVAVDATGNVYVADLGNHTIRKITPAGGVTTLAGMADVAGAADGIGSAARFDDPAGVAVDAAGNVYVADLRNASIRKVTPAGEVSTVAGMRNMAGIVLGTTPRFALPQALAITGDSLVISDANAILLLRHGAR